MTDFDKITQDLRPDLFQDAAEEEQELFSVSVLFTNRFTEEARSVIVPVIFTRIDRAARQQDLFTHNQDRMALLQMWYNFKMRHEADPNVWIPTAVSVVKLAPVPF